VTTRDDADTTGDFTLWRPLRPAEDMPHRRVLVVDDYRDAAEALQLVLEMDGFETRVVCDATEVCEVAQQWQPFAVVLDIAMPGLNGCDVACRLRANPRTAHMLLIAFTALTSTEDRARAQAAGFDAHCAKPLTPQRLLGVLQTVAGR
jgi:CheY-like chemotaxis protein